MTARVLEREVREILSRKVTGNLLGTFLLIPEYLRLGCWDLIKNWTGEEKDGINSKLALQLVNESALCVNRIREKKSLNHRGFAILNGLPFIATDKEIHKLLDSHTMRDANQLQINLARLRNSLGHYKGDIWAFDPHRIVTHSKRIMPKKKSKPQTRSKRVLQTFFCVDAETGQPFGFTLNSSGITVTEASLKLLQMMSTALPEKKSLLVADSEYENSAFISHISRSKRYDILMPVAKFKKKMQIIKNLDYKRHFPGYATAETAYSYKNRKEKVRLIGQRFGESKTNYSYKPFIATGNKLSLELLTENYPKRWKIEEFFNFEGALGWNRASTMNLNIRYGKMSLALIAQAASYQLKKKLPKPYRSWTAEHVANSIFKGVDADLRVNKNTIIVTLYDVPERLRLKKYYENLPEKLKNEGVNPKIPWLYDFEIDFRFK